MHISAIIAITILVISKSSRAIEYNKQQKIHTNTDFLLHEGGIIQSGPQKGNGVTQGTSHNSPTSQNFNQNADKRDYVAQFPPLKPPSSTSQTQIIGTNSGPQRNPQTSNGKRDYVAPQFPTLKPVQQNNQPSTGNTGNYAAQYPALKPTQQNNNLPPGKIRDYVAPQLTTPKPINNQGSTGKVKDLINFYDNNKNTPNGKPSYSTMLQGNKDGQSSSTTRFTQPPQPTSSTHTTTPISFSSVLAGSNKPSNQVTTPKPSSRPPHSTTASRPGSPVLPSSILNNNQGNPNGNRPSDAELKTLSEELLRKDSNNAARYITINYQEKTTSQSKADKAPRPLITASPDVWNIPTIKKFVPLLDNYERDAMVNEYVTPQEKTEENAFMDEIMSSTVIRHLMTFLKNKGYVTPDPRQQRDYMKQLWFGLYSRGSGKIGSSGFEHVFVSEINKRGEVSGLHNWIYFAKEEAANRINYLGYLKYLDINDKGAVMKMHFNQQGLDKPVDTLFVGTSPELEIALYTLCFVTRADNECKLKLANKDVEITTHTFRYRSKNFIGSAYANI